MSRKKSTILLQLNTVEKLANGSKVKRLLHSPIQYSSAILYRLLFYPYYKTSKEVMAHTFFGTKMNLQLPSATDIYLTGGKTHPSEIRLAKFLIHHLKKGNHFLDIGAHYGYFTLLGSKLVGEQGKVFSLEASPTTFDLLNKNVKQQKNIRAFNLAASDKVGTISFFEFPNLYSEYNSMELAQFEKEKWFQKYPPTKCTIEAIDLSSFLTKNDFYPSIIKIDVEGAEYKVISGAEEYLQQYTPFIIMEYLSNKRGNEAHQQAARKLVDAGFCSFSINQNGYLEEVVDVESYLEKHQLDSDNIIFQRD